jgi:pimeloyl-ACP methyl ester carboxylesterase
MIEPILHYLDVPGAKGKSSSQRRIAWWDWNATGEPLPRRVVVCVHGLTRQARDFDTLAAALAPSARVVCVDVAGRGHSDWLSDPMDYQLPTYAGDLACLLAHLRVEYAAAHPGAALGELRIDWVGTSMGGLIGMMLAALPQAAINRLVLNDIGPEIDPASLRRISSYLGKLRVFPSEEIAVQEIKQNCASFGPHTPEQWLALARPMLRPAAAGWILHYDPDIALPFEQQLAAAEAQPPFEPMPESPLWALYDAIEAETLLLRGAESDLLTPSAAQSMTTRGPRARCIEFAGVGHAPSLIPPDQVAAVKDFLFAS